ncbi:5'-3' exonuclease H3TH domain-containing protein [Deinococcus sp. RM]|uniref:variant leucine-rich repeat-containing protein n=1 Tax=Deinococcus sp. RM TaxID=2316359 RepID=UPI0013141CFA|nr:5'-3' exonuclease H3TH domain-containing protein [Deinococcus sp. RM]
MPEVLEAFGVAPAKVPLYKALVGDSSDAIPGVAGIGRVKALPLLQRFNSLDDLFADLDTLDPNIRARLDATPQAQIELYLSLATLVCDAPVEQVTLASSGHQQPVPPTPAWGISRQSVELQPEIFTTPVSEIVTFLRSHTTPGTWSGWSAHWRDQGDLEAFDPDCFLWYLQLIADPTCPPEVLGHLADFQEEALDRMIAWHRNCPREDLTFYRESPDPGVRLGAIHSPDRPSDSWRPLENLTESEIQQALEPIDPLDRAAYLARNPTTPPQQLLSLLRGEVHVRLALASRSAAPTALWSRLGEDANVAVRHRLARNPHAPLTVLKALRDDHQIVQEALASNSAIDEELQLYLADMKRPELSQRLAENPKFTPTWTLGHDMRHFSVKNDSARSVYFWWVALELKVTQTQIRSVVKHAPGAFPLLADWVRHPDEEVRLRLARNPSCPPALLRVLARDFQPVVRSAVAVHAACPPDCRSALQRDVHWHVRRLAGQDFAAPARTLDSLKKVPWDIGRVMAAHASCPPDILTQLAGHADWSVRLMVARHSACPAETLNALGQASEWMVRQAVAGNPSTPVERLAALAADRVLGVRSWVACQSNLPDQDLQRLAQDTSWEVRAACAGNPTLPQASLTALASDSERHIRELVARHQKSDVGALDTLAGDQTWQVRWGVALNPATPAPVLHKLSEDSDEDVRQAVVRHANCPGVVLSSLATDDSDQVKYAVALNSRTPREGLETLMEDDWELRQAVARNPECPLDLLSQLAEDEDDDVRRAVAGNAQAAAQALDPDDLAYLHLLSLDDNQLVCAAVLTQPVAHRPWSADEPFPEDLDDDAIQTLYAEFPDAGLELVTETFHLFPEAVKLQMLRRPDLPWRALRHLVTDEPSSDPEIDETLDLRILNHPSTPSDQAAQLDTLLSGLVTVTYARAAGSPDCDWLDWPVEWTGLFWELVATPDQTHILSPALLHAEDDTLRQAVASNPAIPFHWLVTLADDDNPVALTVARHEATPPSALQRIYENWSGSTELAVAAHPALPASLMAHILQEHPAQHCALARNMALPTPVQLFLATSPDRAVRSTLRENPALAPEARRRLAAYL